jgi:hypothetical protein
METTMPKQTALALNKRQAVIVKMALRYMYDNLDDVNDVFAAVDDDLENINGKVAYAGKVISSIKETEVDDLLGQVERRLIHQHCE